MSDVDIALSHGISRLNLVADDALHLILIALPSRPTVHASNDIAHLCLGPLLEAERMHVISTGRSTVSGLILGREFSKAYRTIALDRFAVLARFIHTCTLWGLRSLGKDGQELGTEECELILKVRWSFEDMVEDLHLA